MCCGRFSETMLRWDPRWAFRDIDVEQIGYIRGPPGYSPSRSTRYIWGCGVRRVKALKIPLSTLEALAVKHSAPKSLASAVLLNGLSATSLP